MAAWTDYGKQQLFAVGVGAIDAPQLYLALFSTSADPAGPPVELVLVGYGRQTIDFGLDATDHGSNRADVSFGPLAVGAYLGLAIIDDPVADTSQAWFWDDELSSVAIAAGSYVTFAASTLLVVRTA